MALPLLLHFSNTLSGLCSDFTAFKNTGSYVGRLIIIIPQSTHQPVFYCVPQTHSNPKQSANIKFHSFLPRNNKQIPLLTQWGVGHFLGNEARKEMEESVICTEQNTVTIPLRI
jgi:hypothetical protein